MQIRKLTDLEWLRTHRMGHILLGIGLALAVALFWWLWNTSGRFAMVVTGLALLPFLLLLFRHPILGTMLSVLIITSDASVLFSPLDTLVPLLTLGVLILRKVYLHDPTWRITPFMQWSLLLFLWHYLSTMWVGNLEFSWVAYHYTSAALMLIIVETVKSREDFRLVVLAAAMGLLITGISAIYSAVVVFMTGIAIKAGRSAGELQNLRLTGHWRFPNAMAYAMMTFIGLCIVFIRRREKLLARMLLIGAVGGALVAVLLSLARGGLLTTTLVVGALALTMRHRWVVIGGTAVVLVLVMTFIPIRLFGRMASLVTGGDTSTSERTLFVQAGLEMISESFPLGLGGGGYMDRSMSHLLHRLAAAASHNTYIDIASEMGLIGMVLFVGMMLALIGPLRARPPDALDDDLHRLVRYAFKVGTVAILIGMLFENSIGSEPYWIFFTLASLRPDIFERPVTQSVM